MKPAIHFAHGNGFPALCYKQFLDHLSEQFDCYHIDKIGHDINYPVTENWTYLVLQIIESIKSQTNRPVVGVGHSLGGVLTLLAAIKNPKLFHSIILLDSPIIGPFKSSVVRLAKTFGVIDLITPAHRTKGRRVYWKDRAELLSYLESRPLFKSFTKECLDDYITYGCEQKGEGYHLQFDRDIEYRIYRTIPHILPDFKRKLQTPAALIYGDKTNVIDKMDRRYMRRYFNVQSYMFPGTHLFPMELPKEAAQKVIDVISLF